MCLQKQFEDFLNVLRTNDIVVFETNVGVKCIGKFTQIHTDEFDVTKHLIHLGWNGKGANIPISMVNESTLRKALKIEIILWKLQDESNLIDSHKYSQVIGGSSNENESDIYNI